MASTLRFGILGPLQVWCHDDLVDIGSRKQRTLLAVLLLSRNDMVTTDTLIDALWGEEPPPSAKNALQVYVSNLRRSLRCGLKSDEGVIHTRPSGYVLDVSDQQVDADRFHSAVLAGQAALAEGDAANASSIFTDALSIWRGPALSEFVYQEFARASANALDEEHLIGLEGKFEAQLALQRHAAVLVELAGLVEQYPLREHFRALHMLALYGSGRQADALQSYHDLRAALSEELGIDPQPELMQLYQSMLRQEVAVPQHVENFHAGTRAGGGRRSVGNLPAQSTPFLGRERELGEILDLLQRQEVRVLTLTGPGGIGKTRLAVQAAIKLAQAYPGGAWFVGLAAITDPGLALGEIASVLEVRESHEGSLTPALAARLSHAHTLVVLDNLEQLLPEAAAAIAELSAAAPSLALIASSREPLRIGAEREYPVATLPEEEAAALFVARAQAARPDFEPHDDGGRAITGICARLDRLPLAIELAAARVKLLPPAELLLRLEQRLPLLTGGARDAPERQRTLRATIAWSHDLLSDDERALFEDLAVFSDGWTLEAAEVVCHAELDTLQSLIERNLVRGGVRDPRRYEMLETIREFALEQMRTRGQDLRLATRHEGYFLSLAVRARSGLRGPDPRPWFDRLESELGNLRAAIDSSLAQGRIMVALRLVVAWAKLWEHRGHWPEGRAWLNAVLAASESMRVPERAKALLASGNLAAFQGEMVTSQVLLEQAVELAREVGDRETLALALSCLAWVVSEHEMDVQRSEALGEQGVSIARDLGDPWVLAESISNVASAYSNLSLAGGVDLIKEGLELRRSINYATGIADSLNNLGFASLLANDYPKASAYVEESLQLALRLDDKPQVVLARDNLALVHLFDGNGALAEQLLHVNLRVCWEIGDQRTAGEALTGLAGAAALAEGWERAAWLAGASMGLAARGGLRRNEHQVRIDERYLVDARKALGDERYEASFERGRVASFEEAVAYALGDVPYVAGSEA